MIQADRLHNSTVTSYTSIHIWCYTDNALCNTTLCLWSVYVDVGVKDDKPRNPLPILLNYFVGRSLNCPLCWIGLFSLCNHKLCKALIDFLKCTMCPNRVAGPFNQAQGCGGGYFQGSLTVAVVMARALKTKLVKSYHLNISKALGHSAPRPIHRCVPLGGRGGGSGGRLLALKQCHD